MMMANVNLNKFLLEVSVGLIWEKSPDIVCVLHDGILVFATLLLQSVLQIRPSRAFITFNVTD